MIEQGTLTLQRTQKLLCDRASAEMVAGSSKKSDPAMLVGLGLDHADGHVRVTKGDNFRILGGSKDTHQQMQEQAIKFNEKLDERGRRLEEVSPQEFMDLAAEVGMNVLPDPPKEKR